MADIYEILKRLRQNDTIKIDTSAFQNISHAIDVNDNDHFNYLAQHLGSTASNSLLDFGCGSAPHRKRIEAIGYRYTGVDIEDSTGFVGERNDEDLVIYDGKSLPFEDSSFDVVYSCQVFEHVLDPFESMAECARVLKSGGAFIGAVSFLEPYHAFQTFSYTPYGFIQIAKRAGLSATKIRANRDVLFILLRKLQIITGQEFSNSRSDYPSLTSCFADALSDKPAKVKALFELNFCGSFSFYFTKTNER